MRILWVGRGCTQKSTGCHPLDLSSFLLLSSYSSNLFDFTALLLPAYLLLIFCLAKALYINRDITAQLHV